MKIMNKFQKKLANRKKDNKGFSLVELIIVIAIMAILVGIVGTQVIPYINKSKEAKDFQIVNSYGTAATTAYSSSAEKTTAATTIVMSDNIATDNSDATGAPSATLAAEIQNLTGYNNITTAFRGKMGSTKGKTIDKIVIVINPTSTDVTATSSAPGAKAKTIVTQAYAGTDKVFDEVVTQL